MMSLSDQIKISTAITPTAGAANTTDINGTVLDMKGWDSVLIIVRFGDITTNAVTSIKAQCGTDGSVTDAADIYGSSQTIADDDDDQTFFIDLVKPPERYVRLVVDRGTQNAVVACANYIQYNRHHYTSTSHGTGVSGEKVVPTVEGTA